MEVKNYDNVKTDASRVSDVDTGMDDEGPKPMRHLKDSQKVRNAADQFSDHHSEYEARGRRSYDRVDRVHRHNTTYPRLYDELDKRTSITKITAVNAQQRHLNVNICEVCKKLRQHIRETDLKRSNYYGKKSRSGNARVSGRKPRARSKRKSTSRYTRVTKPRQRRGKRGRAYRRCYTATDRQNKNYRSRNTNIGRDVDEFKRVRQEVHASDDEALSKDGRPSEMSINPDSDLTVSTNNSNYSLDQEPMVSE